MSEANAVTNIKSRKFGRTGWDVSEIAFGAWQLGGQWGAVDDQESIGALLFAFDSGINFVDTAQMYGLGRSEEIVGRAIRQNKSGKVWVATKGQPPEWPSVEDPNPKYSKLYPRKHLQDQVEGSLRRLGVECIDLYQLHCWAPDGMNNQEWLEVLREFQQQGKIDKIGVSIRDYRPDDGVDLAKSGLVDSLQVIYNIFEQEPDKELFQAAASSGTAIIARVALDSGSLSGAWDESTYASWEPGSVLHTLFRDERFKDTLERVSKLKADVGESFQNLSELAVRFVLDRDEVSTAILGMSSAKRILQNISFSNQPKLGAELKSILPRHEWRRNYYV